MTTQQCMLARAFGASLPFWIGGFFRDVLPLFLRFEIFSVTCKEKYDESCYRWASNADIYFANLV